MAGEQRHGVGARRPARLDRQRQPALGQVGLVLGEAPAVLARAAEGGPVDAVRAWPAPAHVAHDQLQGPPDRGVGPVALAQHVVPAVHADAPGDGTVDDQHRTAEVGRAQQAVDVEVVGAGRLDGGQDHRQVLGLAAGHHRVDGHLLHRGRHQVGRDGGDHVLGIAAGALQHAQHPGLGGGHDRQPVAPAPVEEGLRLVLEAGPDRSAGRGAGRPRSAPAAGRRWSGSTDNEPQPGRMSGRSRPRSDTPARSSQCVRDQPSVRATSRPSSTRSSVGTVSMPWW